MGQKKDFLGGRNRNNEPWKFLKGRRQNSNPGAQSSMQRGRKALHRPRPSTLSLNAIYLAK